MVATYQARKWDEESDGAGEFAIPQVVDGMYPATIIDVEDREFPGYQNGPAQLKYMIKWELDDLVIQGTDGEDHPVTLIQFVTIPAGLIENGYVHPKAQLYKFLKGIGQNPDMGTFTVDPMSWVNVKGLIWVENKASARNPGEMRPQIIKNTLPTAPPRPVGRPMKPTSTAAPVVRRTVTKVASNGDEESDWQSA